MLGSFASLYKTAEEVWTLPQLQQQRALRVFPPRTSKPQSVAAWSLRRTQRLSGVRPRIDKTDRRLLARELLPPYLPKNPLEQQLRKLRRQSYFSKCTRSLQRVPDLLR
jgi:hypothetical protein